MKIGEKVKLQLNSYHFKAERGCNVPRCPAHKPGGAVLARIILFSFVRDVAETRAFHPLMAPAKKNRIPTYIFLQGG